MERKILFINHRPQVVREFTFAMQHQEYTVQTATNGYDAAMLLKNQEFQVVIMGVVLDGYNGEQILTFLNKNRPKTICIIYTTVLTPAQIKFFVNERKVFRVFLRPVDYYTDFPQAIEEAFLEYALRDKYKEERKELESAYKKKKEELLDMAETIERQKRGLGTVKQFLDYLLEKSLYEKKNVLTQIEYKELYQAEIDLVAKYEQYREVRFRNLGTVKDELLKEFASPLRSITFDIHENMSGLLPETFLRKFKIVMWMIFRRYLLLTEKYKSYIQLHASNQKYIIEIIMDIPGSVFRENSKVQAEAVRNNIAKCAIESITEEFVRIEKEDCIKYYMEMT